MVGRTIEHYRILEKLGEGGMGVVFKELDSRLDRFVALKLLAPEKTSDPDRRRRFVQEAKAASALNHPNIVTIYDIGHADGFDYIAMEYIHGRTLQQVVARRGLDVGEAIKIAVQVADAIAAAHGHGIIHRDLKPGNVMVNDTGAVKLLDFGLAKLYEPESGADAETVTIASGETRPGVIVGTVPYLSPERLAGKPVDARSDIFAFGVVLYEMLAGVRPFTGETDPDILYTILHKPPKPLSEIRPDSPVELRLVVEKALEKDPADRYQSMREALVDLKRIHRSTISHPAIAPASAPAVRKRRWIAAAAIVTAVLVFAGVLALRRRSPPGGGRLTLLVSSGEELTHPDLSPDGTMIAYVAREQGRTDLFVSRAAGGERIRLTDDDASEMSPDFSPDGERIAFTRMDPETRLPEVRVIPTFGGQAVTVLRSASSAVWSPDGRRFGYIEWQPGQLTALAIASADGSGERILASGDGAYPLLRYPAWSPDGSKLAVVRSAGGMAAEVWIQPAAGGKMSRVSADPPGIFSDHPVFTPDGRGVIHQSNRAGATNLWIQPLDGSAPARLTSGPGPDESSTVARDGTIAFVNSRGQRVLFVHDLATSRNRDLVTYSSVIWAPSFSAGGDLVTYSQAEPDGSWHIWSVPAAGGAPRRITSDKLPAIYSHFTPDGASVIYNTWSSAPDRVWSVPFVGGPPRPLTLERGEDDAYADVSPDGRFLAFARTESEKTRVYVMPIEGGAARLLVDAPSTVPRWSRNGKWIAFSATRSPTGGIFVIGFNGAGLRRLSADGAWPVWLPDGSKIGYLAAGADGNQQILAVPFQGGTPQPLSSLRFNGVNYPFDVSPDGRTIVTSNTVHLSSEIWKLEPLKP